MADTIIFPAILIPYNGFRHRLADLAVNVAEATRAMFRTTVADEPPRRMPYPARRGAFLENAAMRREMFKL
jgi:hypothetical protein